MDDLWTSIDTQIEYLTCYAFIFTETWLAKDLPDLVIYFQTQSICYSDQRSEPNKSMVVEFAKLTLKDRTVPTIANHKTFKVSKKKKNQALKAGTDVVIDNRFQ